MDCKTAQLLLDFARPQTHELEADEAAVLQAHLDHCPDCHSRARVERQLDAVLSKAMRQVEVPAGLRDQLLRRLEAERGDWHRRRFARGTRRVMAAAALLLLGWGIWYWVADRLLPQVDLQQVADSVNADATEDPRARTEEALRRLGVDTPLSPYLNFNYLACPPVEAELPGYPGRRVVMLLFQRSNRVARVYLIREKAIPSDTPQALDGSTFKAELVPSVGEPYRFLVIHDGVNLEWLRPPAPPVG